MNPETAPSRWSLTHTGNRVLLAVALAWLAWFVAGSIAAGIVVGVIAYALTTALTRGR